MGGMGGISGIGGIGGITGIGGIGGIGGNSNPEKYSNRGSGAGLCAYADTPTIKHNRTTHATTLDLIIDASSICEPLTQMQLTPLRLAQDSEISERWNRNRTANGE